MDSQATAPEKRKITPESPRKTTGSMLKSLRVFLTVPPSKTRTSGQKTQFLEPKNISNNKWSYGFW